MSIRSTSRACFSLGLLNSGKVVCQVLLVCVIGCFSGVSNSQAAVSEAEAKAEFIFRIAQFVDWEMQGTDETFVIAVFADVEFAASLTNSLEGRTIKGKEVSVQLIEELAELGRARVVVVPGANRRRIVRFLGSGIPSNVLTLGDSEAFLKAGGMISMLKSRAGRIRLAAHSETLQSSGLRISSKLMRILSH